MIETVVIICFVMIAVAVSLAFYRLLVGPSILDRIIAFDMVAIGIVGMIILLSIWYRSALFIEIMLIFSLLGFLGSVAFVSFLHKNPEKLKGRGIKKRKHESHPT